MKSLYESPIFLSCFDGEADAAAASAAAAATPPAAPVVADGVKTFNQEQVNAFLAEEKRKTDAKFKTALTQKQTLIDQMLADKTLSEQSRATLEAEKESLQTQLLTKEEKLKAEKKAVEDSLTAKVKETEAKATEWETRFSESTVKRELQEAAVTGEAFNPTQLVTLLKNSSKLEPVMGADGKPTGDHKTVVTLDGKTYSPAEAVAAMKADVAQYGNLFKTPSVAGAGASSAPAFVPGSGQIDWANLTQAQYEQLRGKHPNLPAGKRRS
jgi:hypothetical protein